LRGLPAAGSLAFVLLAGGAADASTLVGLTTGNSLVRFDSSTPGTIAAGPTPITGLSGGESIVEIDYRPATAVLYGISTLSRLFTINPTTGAATLASTLTSPLSGTDFGVDFNPIVDRVRVVSEFRIGNSRTNSQFQLHHS
jgi:hypothetical protein